MPQSAETLDRIPASTLRRWAMKAGAVGFCLGFTAALAALMTN